MKKNNMLRIASVLLVAVLLSTCAISGAFAKYTSGLKEAEDSARVAEWGITVTASGDLFDASYNGGKISAKTNADSSQDDIIAPGAFKEDVALIDLNGSAEVAVKITKTATVDLGDNWVADGNSYCPIIITVGSTDYYVGKDGIADVDALETAVVNAILGTEPTGEYTVAANTDLADTYDVAVSWRWEMTSTTITDQDNEKDTALGLAAKAGTAVPTITISASVTVEQAD